MKRIYLIAVAICTMFSISSCSDFFNEDSNYVINADQDHLNNATDTIYSVVGILNKLQAIADRTILLGEARGDLMTVTDATSADLRDVANFNIGDDNQYNVPRDYYAVINNCNYFIAKVDTAMKNNRNENVFKKEYAAVKAIRAWTYLQLAINYGKVPFVTTPILTKEQAEQTYPVKDIQGICNYFLDEDGLQAMVDQEYPNYGDIKSLPSPLFFMPMRLVLGDLSLWGGRYLDAAKYYYGYIDHRNGTNSSYAINSDLGSFWDDDTWFYASGTTNLNVSNTPNAEVISIIPMDSIPSEGYYSQLINTFNTNGDNDYKASLVPSTSLKKLSAEQDYVHYDKSGKYIIAPKSMSEEMANGDLRLMTYYSSSDNAVDGNGNRYTSQRIGKYTSGKFIRVYRRSTVYMRLAEALNNAGYPRYAYHVLRTGVNKDIVADSIGHFMSEADSTMLVTEFPFPSARYVLYKANNLYSNANTFGIHSRGCGYYDWLGDTKMQRMPFNPAYAGTPIAEGWDAKDTPEQIAWQQKQVEKMLIDENALEFAFEGYRYYDLMRIALKNNDPSVLADRVASRSGVLDVALKARLQDTNNWFLKWNGQIGTDLK